MRNSTIFLYELKRLVCSREYLLLLVALLAYCFFLLRGSVIFGTQYTAPFSQWTFCEYCSSAMTLLLVLLLALCARLFSASELAAMSIINSSAVSALTIKAIRYSAVACAFMFAAILTAVVCFGFYWVVFDFTSVGKHIVTWLALLVPSALCLFGIAILLGKWNPNLIYVLLALILIVGVFRISLSPYVDIFGSTATLPLLNGQHEFAFSTPFIVGRLSLAIIGLAAIVASLRQNHKKG